MLLPTSPPRTASRPSADRLILTVSCLGVAIVWTLWAGKDLAWDFLNHQLYLPYALVTGRFTSDLLAAGPQSYQNPIGYVPMYLLVTSGVPDWAVATLLAVGATAIQVWSLQKLSLLLFGDAPEFRVWRLLATVAALATPVQMLVLGTASTDPLSASLVLAALVGVFQPGPAPRAAWISGATMGLAVAIKPTNLAFALPAFALLTTQAFWRQKSPRWLVIWTTAAAIATGVCAGLWSLWVYGRFGSPMYPLMNDLFHSPYAPAGRTIPYRFLPSEPLDWLTRPIEMAKLKSYVSVEGFAPDGRPLALLATLLAASVAYVWRGRAMAASTATRLPDGPVKQMLFLLALSYAFWLQTSGNARYVLPGLLLCGLVWVRLMAAFRHQHLALFCLSLVAVLPFGSYLVDGDHRLSPFEYSGRAYFEPEVPSVLRDQPVLHLSIGVQSHSALAPWMHRDGAMANLIGQMSLPPDGPLGQDLQRLIARWTGRIRFLIVSPLAAGDPRLAVSLAHESAPLMHRFGLAMDGSDCVPIGMPGTRRLDTEVALTAPPSDARNLLGRRHVLSCRAIERRRLDPAMDAELASMDRMFDVIERACPGPFGPRPLVTDVSALGYSRRYMNSDLLVIASRADGVLVRFHRARLPVELGTVEQVVETNGSGACAAWMQLKSQ